MSSMNIKSITTSPFKRASFQPRHGSDWSYRRCDMPLWFFALRFALLLIRTGNARGELIRAQGKQSIDACLASLMNPELNENKLLHN